MSLKVNKKYGTSSVMIEVTHDELDAIVVDYLKDIYTSLNGSVKEYKESIDFINDCVTLRSIEGVLFYINTLKDTVNFLKEENKINKAIYKPFIDKE